jgi:hypothetical protein
MLLELSAVTIEKCELCLALGQKFCNRGTDPHRGAGDQRNFFREFRHRIALFVLMALNTQRSPT